MKKTYPQKALIKLSGLLTLVLMLLIANGCHKDSTYQDISQNITDTEVLAAQTWYNNTYLNSTTVKTNGVGNTISFAKIIHANWQKAVKYNRFGKTVIEMPDDKSGNILPTFKSLHKAFSSKYIKSSVLILKDNKGYSSYIMTIIADSIYLKNDFVKLANNTYSKKDADFTGTVLYFTPAGKYVSGYAYRQGKLLIPSTLANQTTSNKVNDYGECIDWYLQYRDAQTGVLLDEEYLYTTCPGGGADDGAIPNCSTNGVTGLAPGSKVQINSMEPDPDPTTDPGTGFPDPTTSTCTVPDIIDSLLKKTFPCASKLIIDSLKKIPGFSALTSAFNTPLYPSLIYVNGTLPWNASGINGSTTYQYGLTTSGTPSNASSTITLNTSMLQNSSMLLIASVAIHETLHGVINYNIEWAGGNIVDGHESWMDGLNSWYLINGLPSNFRDHYEMMDYYFNQSVAILAQWDHNQHTQKEYIMAMLTGLDNPGTNSNSDPNFATKAQLLATEYATLKSNNNISDTDLDNFKTANNNATSTAKLPTGGCN